MLQIIQGDIFEVNFELCGVDFTMIEKVLFTSSQLGIDDEVISGESGYTLRIGSERTSLLPVGFASYDLTIVFKDCQQLTAQHNEYIEILKKDNVADG